MQDIMKSAKSLKSELIEIRRALHQHPEVGRSLPWTKNFIIKKLKEYGYEPREMGGSGVVATVQGGEKGKAILLRADMDGLAIKEKAPVPFAAQGGTMHACGHDMHTAMLLGAAKLLRQYQSHIDGTIKLAFQPDEEGFTGAKEMIEAGILENPHIDAGMALHVHSGAPSGTVICGVGTCLSGCTLFRIRVKGKGCHGALPETGVDPINIAAHIYLALQAINAREVSPQTPVVLTMGKFSGGEAPNIIPEEVVMEGTIRTMDRELASQIFTRMEEIALQTALMFRGSAEVEEMASVPPLHNHAGMVREIAGYIREAYDPDRVIFSEKGVMASEDFASYTYEIPCCYLLVGAGSPQEDELYGKPMHNNCVVFNEDVLPLGGFLYAYGAVRWLQSH
ncbi:MAG: amidohydrolase [Lachnospiraceae bacterium]|nr:amidohydrolase [Lachnospiraceae bacterium]